MRLFITQYLILVVLLIVLANCRQRLSGDSRVIFDLEKLLDDQVSRLTKGNFEVHKKTIIDDSVESFYLAPDSLGWQKELSLFKTADIHKPGLRGFYRKDIYNEKDTRIEQYTLEDTSQSETLYLKINRDSVSEKILSIIAAQQTDNPIYRSRRDLYLYFIHPEQDQIQLDSFVVKGYQKMILQDTVRYFTAGKIVEPD